MADCTVKRQPKLNTSSTVTGTIDATPSGLKIAGKITIVPLNDSTWTALPATPLVNRNAISVQNQSLIEVKINYNNAQAGYVGMIIPPGGERFIDITEAIPVYAKAKSGTPSVAVEEIS